MSGRTSHPIAHPVAWTAEMGSSWKWGVIECFRAPTHAHSWGRL